jgi:serine/threonine protein kinase
MTEFFVPMVKAKTKRRLPAKPSKKPKRTRAKKAVAAVAPAPGAVAPLVWRSPVGTIEVRNARGEPERFVIDAHRYLGRGATGHVFVAAGPAGERVVIKMAISVGTNHEWRIRNEADAYAEVEGTPELPHFYGLGVDERGFPTLVVDFIDGQPLHSTDATRADPSLAVRIVGKVLNAVVALNDKGRSHRDLARPNILIQGDAPETLRVFDLGMAVKLAERFEYGGTPFYAPEQTAALPSEGRMNGDVYSVGAHLLELITGLEPRPENMELAWTLVPELTAAIGGKTVTLRQIIESALIADPAKRLQSAREMRRLLEPFMSLP